MTKFMVSLKFIPNHQSEIAALVPQERTHIADLRRQGIIETMYLSQENGGLVWIVMQGESKADIQKALKSFPLFPYMVPEITTLT